MEVTTWVEALRPEGLQTDRFPQSMPEPVRVVRRGHPFDGWELAVLRCWRTADGQLRLWVELPDGRQRALPASWTSLEALPDDLPRARGRTADYAALLKLVEALEPRCRGRDAQHRRAGRDPAGSAAAPGAHGALGERAAGRSREAAGQQADRLAALDAQETPHLRTRRTLARIRPVGPQPAGARPTPRTRRRSCQIPGPLANIVLVGEIGLEKDLHGCTGHGPASWCRAGHL